jgi:heme exporter protein CcmD
MAEFFAMGGYGLYVWSSYGVVTLVLAYVAYSSWRGYGRRRRELENQERRGARRRSS